MKPHDPHPRSPHSWTPWMRQNNPKSNQNPTLGRNVPIDSRLHQRMCNLPTKQNPDPPDKDPPLSYYNKRRNPPFPTNRDGPHYGASAASRTQRHTNHSRPWMLTCSHLPPVFRHYHGPWNRSALLRLCLPMVQSADQNDKRSRP